MLTATSVSMHWKLAEVIEYEGHSISSALHIDSDELDEWNLAHFKLNSIVAHMQGLVLIAFPMVWNWHFEKSNFSIVKIKMFSKMAFFGRKHELICKSAFEKKLFAPDRLLRLYRSPRYIICPPPPVCCCQFFAVNDFNSWENDSFLWALFERAQRK